MIINKWLDDNGFIHTSKFPAIDQSENGPMFTGLLRLFIPTTITDHWTIMDIVGNFRANSNREYGSHFSHDNMTGLYCILNGPFKGYKNLPIAKWNGKWWLHPRDLAFYFWCHYPKLGLLTLWIASLAMIISCIQTYKVRDGIKYIKTDGKLLTYLRCKSFNMHITMRICTYIIEHHDYFTCWNDVAKRYFKVKGHPLRSLIQ